MVILDTNIIIDHLRKKSKDESRLLQIVQQESKDALGISVISLQELFEGQSTKNEKKSNDLLAILSPIKILEYNIQIAQLAGEIARDLQNPIEFADAAIAATCIFNNSKLFTLNRKHFLKIKNLELY